VSTKRQTASAYLLLFGGMAVVGSYVAFSKVLVAAIPIFLLALMRFTLGAVVLVPFTFRKGAIAQIVRYRGTLFLQSFFGNFLFSICMLFGVARTSAVAAGLILSTLPAVVALFSALALREPLDGRTRLAIGLAVLGVASLSLERAPPSSAVAPIVGNLLVLGAVCCEAAYVVLGKRLTSADFAPMQITAWINLVGLALVAPLGIWQASHFDFDTMHAHLWTLLVLYALGASVISTALWLTGLKSVPANQAGVFTVALPLSAAFVGVVFLGEHLSAAEILAFACAASGIVLIAFRRSARS
jgi:drug/metabolite transporter (DMT)-like permease